MKNKTTLIVAMIGTIFFTNFSFSQLVTSGLDDGSEGTLRQEIMDTPPGGIITFAAAVTNVNLNLELTIDKAITINDALGDPVIIDAGTNGRIFNVTTGPLTLNNLTLQNGIADDGGAIFTVAAVTLNDCIVRNNTANGTSGSGGGIFIDTGGSLTAINSEITGNTANRAGGGIEDNSGAGIGVTLTNVNLDGNNAGVTPATAAPGNGGGLHITGAGDSNITGGTANNNVAAAEGGALWNGSGTMTIDGTTIEGNTASGADATNGGGGLFNIGGTLTVSNVIIINNVADGIAGSGGAILNVNGGTLSVSDSSITGNSSNRAGGGIEDNSTVDMGSGPLVGSVTLTNVTLDNNTTGNAPGNGGGIHLTGGANSVISGGTVNNNVAGKEGGGLWNGSGTMTIDGTTIMGNEAQGDLVPGVPGTLEIVGGGGIFANDNGTVIIEAGTEISQNEATGVQGSGGGILMAVGSTLTMNGTAGTPILINNNRASRAGGAIEDWSLDTTTNNMTEVNFNGNTAGVDAGTFFTNGGPGNGGTIHVTGPGNNNITGGFVLSGVAASEGGGLWNGSGTMNVDDVQINAGFARGNDATNGGGGLFNIGGTLNVTNSEIGNNRAEGISGSGGGILNVNGGTLSVTNTSITGNFASRAGGGIEDNSTVDEGSGPLVGSVTLTNVTLNSNMTGSTPGNGGGMHLTGGANSVITGGTVNSNTAVSEGGGLWNGTGVMTVDGTTIDGNTASGATATEGGGGIFALPTGTVNIVNGATISNNIAEGASGSGGGILVDQASLSVMNSSITGNRSNRAGGGIEVNAGAGTISLTNVTLDNNNTGVAPAVAAPGNGGGLHITGMQNISITGGTVSGNTAASEGGGLWNGTGTMTIGGGTTIDGNIASGNTAAEGGGGIYALSGGSLVIATGTTISNNVADGTSGSGGGLLLEAANMEIDAATFSGNTANRAGGAIEIIAGTSLTMTINDTDMMDNDAGITGSAAPGSGGAIHISGSTSTLSITSSDFTSNEAANEGGALWTNGIVNLNTSTVDGNSSVNDGGGVYVQGGTTNVLQSTLSNNESTAANGGGLGLGTVGVANVDRVTISGNSAVNGGGAATSGSTNINMTKSTVAFNTATTAGGGISAIAGNVTIDNTIVSNNTAPTGNDYVGTLTSADYNLVMDTSGGTFVLMSNDVPGQDPALLALADNGGTTFTHALGNTQAQDEGNPADTSVDQIGQAVFDNPTKPANARDIGAFEAQVALSIEDFNDVAVLNIFPNPSNGQFNVVIDNSISGDVNLQIVSMSGQLVKQLRLGNGTNEVNLGQMAIGIYIMNINSERGRSTHKVVIE